MDEKKPVRIGVFLDNELLKRCDAAVPLTDCRSRSEFICRALDFYITQLNADKDTRLLLPAMDEALDGRMRDTENRLSRVLYKLGVEVAMMMHVVAATNEIDEGQLDDLRLLCQDEVARLSGRYRFDDAVRFQR